MVGKWVRRRNSEERAHQVVDVDVTGRYLITGCGLRLAMSEHRKTMPTYQCVECWEVTVRRCGRGRAVEGADAPSDDQSPR